VEKFVFTFSFEMALMGTGSQEMALVQLFIPTEAGRTTMSDLGELGSVHFLDVCEPKSRVHAKQHMLRV
jgi:hypothetical protein